MCACAYYIPTPYAWGYHHARESPTTDSILNTADVFLSRCVLITNYNNI